MSLTQPNSQTLRERIIALKQTPNAYGLPHSYAEIAPMVGLNSKQSARWHVRDLQKNVCPCCLRALVKTNGK